MTEATQTPATGTENKAAKKEVVYTPVKMTDGSTVDFPGETKALKSFVSKDGAVHGQINFRNGRQVELVLEEPELILLAAAHGLGQKLGDSYAAIKDVDEMFQTCATLADRIRSEGIAGWNKQSTGGGSAGLGLLVTALMEATSVPEAQVRAYLDTLDAATKKALREVDPTISPIYTRLKAERDAKSPKPAVDTTGALAGLMKLGAAKAQDTDGEPEAEEV